MQEVKFNIKTKDCITNTTFKANEINFIRRAGEFEQIDMLVMKFFIELNIANISDSAKIDLGNNKFETDDYILLKNTYKNLERTFENNYAFKNIDNYCLINTNNIYNVNVNLKNKKAPKLEIVFKDKTTCTIITKNAEEIKTNIDNRYVEDICDFNIFN